MSCHPWSAAESGLDNPAEAPPALPHAIRSDAHYTDLIFEKVELARTRLTACHFSHCSFRRCSFMESALDNCRFLDCTFDGCDLSLAELNGSTFSHVQLNDTKAVGIDWTRASWPAKGIGKPIGFLESAISHSTFIGLSLREIQIRDCIAADVDFREADLSPADFSGTDLTDSLFLLTDLRQADLSRARNYRIDPGQNKISRAEFSLPEAISLLYSMDIEMIEDRDRLD